MPSIIGSLSQCRATEESWAKAHKKTWSTRKKLVWVKKKKIGTESPVCLAHKRGKNLFSVCQYLCYASTFNYLWIQCSFIFSFSFALSLSVFFVYRNASLQLFFIFIIICFCIFQRHKEIKRNEKLLIRIKNSRAKQNTAAILSLVRSLQNIRFDLCEIYRHNVRALVHLLPSASLPSSVTWFGTAAHINRLHRNKNTNVQFLNRNSQL